MGMPVVVEIPGSAEEGPFERVFSFLTDVDARFSTYKKDSEIMRINRGEVSETEYSPDMREIFALAEKTRRQTAGYFNIKRPDGILDPSGVVKGWAILRAARLILKMGFKSCLVDIGGDIQTYGKNAEGAEWKVGVRNPFNRDEIVKVLCPQGSGVATSGTAARGQHIYNPHDRRPLADMVSMTVIGPNVCEADRFATAAFAMGKGGLCFIEELTGFEGYAIGRDKVATMTSGFERYAP